MNKKALVFGATGKTGTQICEQLGRQKIDYAVFVRKESIDKIGAKTTVLSGDVMTREDVRAALTADHFTDIIVSLGSKALKGTTIRSEGTKNILLAMKELELNATVHVISALGVGESWSQLKWHSKLLTNLVLKSVMKDHALQENLVTESGFKHHIIRPVGLKDGEATGSILVQDQGFVPRTYVQRADVAQYLVDSLKEGKTGFSSIC